MIKIAVVLEACEEGGFSVHVPTLPGCFSQGESIDEAIINIREAIELHVEATEHDLVPEQDHRIFELSWEPIAKATQLEFVGSLKDPQPVADSDLKRTPQTVESLNPGVLGVSITTPKGRE